MSTRTRPKKSTNVRSFFASMQPASMLRLSLLHAAARRIPGAPGLAAAERLFFATARFATPRRERDAAATGTRLRLSHRGRELVGWSWGRGPAVLLVHGWNGRGLQLSAFVAPLVARGHRVLAFDLGGHGEASARDASAISMAEDLLAIGQRFGPLAGVIAHSFGGPVTALALLSGLSVSRLAFIAAPYRADEWLDRFARLLRYDGARRRALRSRIETRLGLDVAEVSVPLLLSRAPERFAAPLLVVHDEDDTEVSPAAGATLAASWPGAALWTTRGLGHRRILRDPAVVDRIVAHITDRGEEQAA